MGEPMYLACDFSGIQRYVLAVKSLGKAQAKRLRSRSFMLELFERAALNTVKARLGVADDEVLTSGGGGFLVQISPRVDQAEIQTTASKLEKRLWSETGGEVHVSFGSGRTPIDARLELEYSKRHAASFVLQGEKGWCTNVLSCRPLDGPCEICRQAQGVNKIEGDNEGSALLCERCNIARRLGEKLTRWDWMHPVGKGGGTMQVLGVGFEPTDSETSDAFKVSRWIPRQGHQPMTFEEISRQAAGAKRLAVLKADVDDMGKRISEIIRHDPSYHLLKEFSRDLHLFFVDDLQQMLSDRWQSIYTIYAGGDDLLLVGPWDKVLDFAGAFVQDFNACPGSQYDLTLSAGITLTPYRVPIRHGVERSEFLLELAKGQDGKNSCAALDSIWAWGRHDSVIENGKKLAGWIDDGHVARSLLRRFLDLAESTDPSRVARWAYQVHRNIHELEVRRWASNVEASLDRDNQRVGETAASLRYALLATRS